MTKLTNEDSAEDKAHSTLQKSVDALEKKTESNQKLDISNHDSEQAAEQKLAQSVKSEQQKDLAA